MSESEVKAPVKPVDVEITLDQADAWGFGGLSNQFSVPERGIKMPVDRDSETYLQYESQATWLRPNFQSQKFRSPPGFENSTTHIAIPVIHIVGFGITINGHFNTSLGY